MKKITLAALFCTLLAVCSVISVPTPFGVPVTLQTFAVCLIALCLPLKYALCSYIAYIALGACGLPVFSSFGGGIGVLFGPTGGFVFGFIFIILLCGWRRNAGFKAKSLWGALGIILCHTSGTLWFSLVTSTPFLSAVLVCSAPFLIKDIMSLMLSVFIADRIKQHF